MAATAEAKLRAPRRSKQGRRSQQLEEGSPIIQVILKQVILKFSLRLHNVLIPHGAIARSTYAARCFQY